MIVLAGLGNPGRDYQNNRHNIGFMAVDSIYEHGAFSPWRTKFHAQIAESAGGAEKILLVKPQTYMNNSGQALAALSQFYKLKPADIIVFHDELDLAPDKIRIKTGGSPNGHNGIKSIDAHCGKEYRRVRLGIGHPGHQEGLVHNHVMGDFSKAEMRRLTPQLAAIGRHIGLLVNGDANGFMNKIFTETHDVSANNGHTAASKTAAAPQAEPLKKPVGRSEKQ